MSTIFFTINLSDELLLFLNHHLYYFFTRHLNLKWQIYCENIVNITLQKHKYSSYYQDIYTIKARIYFYNYLIK